MRMRRQNIMYLPLFLVKQFKSLPTPSPFAFNLFQHQSLFQWVSSFHKVTKRLSLQLQHQSLKYFQGKTHISYDSCICSQVFTTRETWEARYLLGSERCPGGGRGNPLQYSCLGNAMDRGAWCATAHRVEKSLTWLKWLSMHVRIHTHTCTHTHTHTHTYTYTHIFYVWPQAFSKFYTFFKLSQDIWQFYICTGSVALKYLST